MSAVISDDAIDNLIQLLDGLKSSQAISTITDLEGDPIKLDSEYMDADGMVYKIIGVRPNKSHNVVAMNVSNKEIEFNLKLLKGRWLTPYTRH